MEMNDEIYSLPMYGEIIGYVSCYKMVNGIITITMCLDRKYTIKIYEDELLDDVDLDKLSGSISILKTKSGYYIKNNEVI